MGKAKVLVPENFAECSGQADLMEETLALCALSRYFVISIILNIYSSLIFVLQIPGYGSLTEPITMGSGGYLFGSSGGGVIRINVANNLTIGIPFFHLLYPFLFELT